MRVDTIQLPSIDIIADTIYESKSKPGSRYEYSLGITSDLKTLASKISDTPLKFASLVLAVPGDENQEFHADSQKGERAIVYMNDVLSVDNGPIEFLDEGCVLGKAGTYVHYAANEIHRGTKSNTNRYALALAFNHDDEIIDTVGGLVCDYKCPFGFKNKSCLDPCDQENCCELDPLTYVGIAVGVLIILWLLYRAFSKSKKIY